MSNRTPIDPGVRDGLGTEPAPASIAAEHALYREIVRNSSDG